MLFAHSRNVKQIPMQSLISNQCVISEMKQFEISYVPDESVYKYDLPQEKKTLCLHTCTLSVSFNFPQLITI